MTLIHKGDKDIVRKKTQISVNTDGSYKQNSCKWNLTIIKKILYHSQLLFYDYKVALILKKSI